jgi:dinuclear metal center YbgI/SA1388 family protein
MTIELLMNFLEAYAPSRLAEDWDNVGLLLGDRTAHASRVMTCLTVTGATVAEAIQQRANLIVTHHPLPFRPLKRLTTDSTTGGLIWRLASAGIAVYSPHTAFDSAQRGINQCLAERLGLSDIQPLCPRENDPQQLGAGRMGRLPRPCSLQELAERLKVCLSVDGLHRVGETQQVIQRVAVACGSAGKFLDAAKRQGCEAFVTGEASFHTCLEAEAIGVGLLLPGHYATERFAVVLLSGAITKEFPDLEVWASQAETDPLAWC